MKIKKTDYEKMMKAYFEGLREGITLYSHLHNGVQYVSYGKTLQEAINEINAEEISALLKIEENPEVLL